MSESERTELIELAKLLAQVKRRLEQVIERYAKAEEEKARLLTA